MMDHASWGAVLIGWGFAIPFYLIARWYDRKNPRQYNGRKK